jgi:hypothetical protein
MYESSGILTAAQGLFPKIINVLNFGTSELVIVNVLHANSRIFHKQIEVK